MEYGKLSIVVAMRNEERTLRVILNSYVTNDYPNKEIILVDDESTDATPIIAKEFARQYPFVKYHRITHDKKSGGNPVYRYGLRKATGDYIFLGDCGVILETKDFFRRGIQRLQEEGVGGVVPRCSIWVTDSFILKAKAPLYDLRYDNIKHIEKQIQRGEIYPQIYSRKVFNDVGGLSENIPWAVDTDLAKKMLQKGYKLVYEPRMKLKHQYRDSIATLLEYHFRFGRLNKGAWKSHKQVIKSLYFLSLFPLLGLGLWNPLFLLGVLVHPLPFIIRMISLSIKAKEHPYRAYLLFYPLMTYIQNIPYSIGMIYGLFT